MTRTRSDLLERIATTLRSEVAPAVGVTSETSEYSRTQTHMAAVILRRVARELATWEVHARLERDDLAVLHAELVALIGDPPDDPALAEAAAAVRHLGTTRTMVALVPIIEAFCAGPAEVCDNALRLIRPVLRRDIDRRLEIARD